MGQYYKPVNLDKKKFVYSHDYGNGLKLMEHSWIDNDFVAIVENLIKKGGDWYGDRIVWAGDYAKNEPKRKHNLYHIVGENSIKPKAINKEKRAGRPKSKQCEICGVEDKIVFDHDHQTNKFRGWICNNCNWILGLAKDDKERLSLIIKYLNKYESSIYHEEGMD